jgi:hypothetical protein
MGNDYQVVSRNQSGAELTSLMQAEAQDALAKRFERAIQVRRSTRDRGDRAMRLTHDAVATVLEANDNYRAGMTQLRKETIEDLRRSDYAGRIDASVRDGNAPAFTESGALQVLAGDARADTTRRNHLNIFGAPYVHSWEHSEGAGAPHARQQTWANAGTGDIGFDFLIFPERGNVFCGAAVWVNFMRQAPGLPPGHGAPGRVQVRTYAPYNYMWNNMSGMEAAHSEAGFGVYVLSWDLDGKDRVVEQDYYDALIWDNTTDWNWNRGNQSFPDPDWDVPLQFPHPPDFPIRPGRLYSAAVWCFGSGSAVGQLTEFRASLAKSRLEAKVVLVVVDQH